MSNLNPLQGKCGAVLGVANSRSIAWGIARAAHGAGARLAFNYQNERLEGQVRSLTGEFGDALCLPCDLNDEDQIDRFFRKVGRSFGGKLDFLVHSVAFARKEDLAGRYVETPREGFRLAMEVSVFSLVAAARRAHPLMQAAGGGSIITLSYLGAERVMPHYNVMGVAKAALEASVRYLASDLGGDAIRVNAISSGPIKTLSARSISGFSEMLDHVARRAPLRRNTTVDEVADTALYLLGDAGRGVTGETLHVDGGYNVMGL